MGPNPETLAQILTHVKYQCKINPHQKELECEKKGEQESQKLLEAKISESTGRPVLSPAPLLAACPEEPATRVPRANGAAGAAAGVAKEPGESSPVLGFQSSHEMALENHCPVGILRATRGFD